jgi:hypothetical protein
MVVQIFQLKIYDNKIKQNTMKFKIEEEVNEFAINFYVWVQTDEKLFNSTCFSIHKTLEEAKEEIEKIKDIFPDKNEHYINLPEGYPQEVKVAKETILDRNDNYKIKDVFFLYNDGRYVCRKDTIESMMIEVDEVVERRNRIKNKKSSIVFEIEVEKELKPDGV